ncbi:MAG TPA: amidophosphoribosyltransferase [Phycisphaerales bacterium]|nr:amidophosphoribosyltransferase [Phycisphaerales bacterium]
MPRRVQLPVLLPAGRGGAVGTGAVRAHAGSEHHAAYEKKEKCAVVGVWGGPSPAHLAYLGLYAQQHRGQESAGIAVSDGRVLSGLTGMGLVSEVFDTDNLAKLERNGGRGAIGHNRYSTAGGSLACNAQPLIESYIGGQIALAHNGNLVNAAALRDQFEQAGHIFHTTSDTEVIVHLLASPVQQRAVDPLGATLRHLQGAFSLVLLTPDRLEACRDPWGWRPLVIGRLADGRYMAASETVALDVAGASFEREVEPGEIVTISDRGLSSRRYADRPPRLAMCIFEHVYFANPSSNVFGQNVQIARELMGEKLALEAPVEADYVVPMPDSGRSAGVGYARASGVPYREAIVPNRYVGRTFIKPSQAERNAAVRLKLNVIRELVEGKRLVVVDDSIVRGTTTRAKIEQIRQAGAREVHLRISCPPIRYPCYFGVDFASRQQLIASGRTVEEVRGYLGVDSLHYLSLEGLTSCMERAAPDYCTACYSGDYRVDVEHPTTEEVATPQLQMF